MGNASNWKGQQQDVFGRVVYIDSGLTNKGTPRVKLRILDDRGGVQADSSGTFRNLDKMETVLFYDAFADLIVKTVQTGDIIAVSGDVNEGTFQPEDDPGRTIEFRNVIGREFKHCNRPAATKMAAGYDVLDRDDNDEEPEEISELDYAIAEGEPGDDDFLRSI